MNGAKYTGRSRYGDGEKILSKKNIVKYSVFFIALSVFSVMQTSFVKVNSNPVGLTLLFVSAVGMLFGERDGGIVGLIGGLIVDCLSGGVIYTSALIYAVIGYLCGICVSRFLGRNLPSYIVYMLVVGIAKQATNVLYFVMLSDNFNLLEIFVKRLVPDYLSFIIFSPIIYGFTYILYNILNFKKNIKY